MSSDNQPRRKILPRSTTTDETTATPAAQSVLPSSDSSLISTTLRPSGSTQSRTNIRSACLACRRRRSRCTGGNPCHRCRALETECLYNETQDGRTRALRERSKEELDLHKKVVSGVFRAVREGQEHTLLELIRNHASLSDVAAAIDEEGLDSPSESVSEPPEANTLFGLDQVDGNVNQPLTSLQQGPLMGLPDEFTVSSSTNLFAQEFSHGSASSSSLHAGSLLDQQSATGTSDLSLDSTHAVESHNNSDVRNLTSLFTNFKEAATQMIAQGVPTAQILGGPGVSCNILFQRQQSYFGVAMWASTVVKIPTGVDILFRLAWLCYLTRYMRWAVDPTEDNLKFVPPAMVHTPTQIAIPHAGAIDIVPIPQIRDHMIRNFRDFFIALEYAGATIHWPESFDDAIDRDPLTGDMTVSAKFENHISNVNNFCFGRNMLKIFPDIEGQFTGIAEQDQIVSVSSGQSPGP